MSTTEPNPRNGDDAWQQKYRDAVRESSASENRWREEETRLHKNLLRLSFSHLGVDADLDRRLKQLQIELKKNPDPELRGKLIDAIVDQIAQATDERDGGDSQYGASAVITSLLDELRLPEAYANERALISSRFKRDDGSMLRENVERLADLLNEVTGAHEESAGGRLSDNFIEFLSKFSLPGSLGEKVKAMQKRSTEIKTDLERLVVIDDTIALISEELQGDPPTGGGATETQAIVRELIDWMTLPSQVKADLVDVQSKLDGAESQNDLSAILRDLGFTVSQFHSTLMSELTDVEYYLKNVAVRLKELQLGIEDSFKDQRESLGEQEDLNSGVTNQVVAMAARMVDENDLDTIKHLIDEGLSEIRTQMDEHLVRDRARVARGEKRLEALSERLTKMDEESTRLRAQVQQERARAQRDALTGIPNRSAYDERIKTETARHDRHNRPVSRAVIDIDKFKYVNDHFGHKAGDKVLKNLARICVSKVRATDFLARYGGEEFVLILAETPLAQAQLVAEKLREEIAGKGFYCNGERVPITVSIGIAEFARAETADEVFQRADRALYAAKDRGRNRCVTESELGNL